MHMAAELPVAWRGLYEQCSLAAGCTRVLHAGPSQQVLHALPASTVYSHHVWRCTIASCTATGRSLHCFISRAVLTYLHEWSTFWAAVLLTAHVAPGRQCTSQLSGATVASEPSAALPVQVSS